MVKVGVIGSTGYTGMELLKLLLRHPEVTIQAITAHTKAGGRIEEEFPWLKGQLSMECSPLNIEEVASDVDLVFLALPHGVSMEYAGQFLEREIKVIDLSGDFRIKDRALYEQYYAKEHTTSHLLKDAVYGLPELHREEIKKARFVANPGCYPVGIILAAAPLLAEGLVNTKNIIIDSKSGTTGAGRKPGPMLHFAECNENVRAYKVGVHQHLPEIVQELAHVAGSDVSVDFTPHLVPLNRGILSTLYFELQQKLDSQSIRKHYKKFYNGEPFVRLLDEMHLPEVKNVLGLNYCDLWAEISPATGRLIVIAAIDNLVKGAAGQAVQNMNIMLGLDETLGLF